MPYIRKADQMRLHKFSVPVNAGELNYMITKSIMNYLTRHPGKNFHYNDINEVMGVLECVKQEFYRRVASPYEESKMEANGDVY